MIAQSNFLEMIKSFRKIVAYITKITTN